MFRKKHTLIKERLIFLVAFLALMQVFGIILLMYFGKLAVVPTLENNQKATENVKIEQKKIPWKAEKQNDAQKAVEIKDESGLLRLGPYRVKKIQDIVLKSSEGAPRQTNTVNVLFDVYYPQKVDDSPLKERFPVVVISHPTVTLSMAPARKQFDYLADHLVSHGYIVLIYEWSQDLNQCQIFQNAQREQNILNYLAVENLDSYSHLYNIVDIEHVGLIGHSNGSFAQYFAKTDSRVKAFIAFAGLLCEWGGLYRDVSDLEKPFMYIGGTRDQLRADTSRYQFYGLWDLHKGPKLMFDIIGGDHWQFTDDYNYYPDVVRHYSENEVIFKNLYSICEKELADNRPTNDQHCIFPTIDRFLQQRMVKYFVTAFFEVYLKNSTKFAPILLNPEYKDLVANYFVENIVQPK